MPQVGLYLYLSPQLVLYFVLLQLSLIECLERHSSMGASKT
jgi:hypothetical protein